ASASKRSSPVCNRTPSSCARFTTSSTESSLCSVSSPRRRTVSAFSVRVTCPSSVCFMTVRCCVNGACVLREVTKCPVCTSIGWTVCSSVKCWVAPSRSRAQTGEPPSSDRWTGVVSADGQRAGVLVAGGAVGEFERRGAAECEARIAPPSSALHVRHHRHVRAAVVDPVHPAKGAANGEAEVFEGSGKDLRVLEAVATAPPAHELVLDRLGVDAACPAEEHVHVRERKGVHVRLVQSREHLQTRLAAGDTD